MGCKYSNHKKISACLSGVLVQSGPVRSSWTPPDRTVRRSVRPKLDPLKVQLVSRKPSFGPFSYEEQMNLDTKECFWTDDLSNSYWLTNHKRPFKKHQFKKHSKAANFQSLQDKGFISWHLIAPPIYVPYLVSHPLYFVDSG